jgi:hypothetical protein
MKINTSKIVIYTIVFIVILFFFDFFYRTLIYRNHLTKCKDDGLFCGIKIINIFLPHEYNYKLLDLAKNKGVRIEIIKKKQKNISYTEIEKHIPQIGSWYNSLSYSISNIIGEKVVPLDKQFKNRLSLVVYEKEGDFIDWHFDTNHFNGRYFTLLVPVTLEETCGNYVYKNKDTKDIIVNLKENQAVLFEGDKVFHAGKQLCANQFRAILSMTFVTSNEMNIWNYTMNSMKEFGVFGKQ